MNLATLQTAHDRLPLALDGRPEGRSSNASALTVTREALAVMMYRLIATEESPYSAFAISAAGTATLATAGGHLDVLQPRSDGLYDLTRVGWRAAAVQPS